MKSKKEEKDVDKIEMKTAFFNFITFLICLSFTILAPILLDCDIKITIGMTAWICGVSGLFCLAFRR